MQRIRIRYTKEGRVRFVSARDLTSVWERALRRADLPIHYSEGFTPHAKVSFPDALPVGVASTGEYAELTFAAPIDPPTDLERLSATLPEGMDITTFSEVPDGATKLARMLSETLWELEYFASAPEQAAAEVEALQRCAQRVIATDAVEVARRRADGEQLLDIRPAVLALAASSRPADAVPDTCPVLRAVLSNDGPTVRPSDLHNALAAVPTGASALGRPRLMRRVAQGAHEPEGLREALSREVVPLVPDVVAEAA